MGWVTLDDGQHVTITAVRFSPLVGSAGRQYRSRARAISARSAQVCGGRCGWSWWTSVLQNLRVARRGAPGIIRGEPIVRAHVTSYGNGACASAMRGQDSQNLSAYFYAERPWFFGRAIGAGGHRSVFCLRVQSFPRYPTSPHRSPSGPATRVAASLAAALRWHATEYSAVRQDWQSRGPGSHGMAGALQPSRMSPGLEKSFIVTSPSLVLSLPRQSTRSPRSGSGRWSDRRAGGTGRGHRRSPPDSARSRRAGGRCGKWWASAGVRIGCQ